MRLAGRSPASTRWTSSPRRAPAAAVIRQWLDWAAPTVTSERAPAAAASAHRNSSLRALLPPAPSPVRSSRLIHNRAPPGSSGPRSSGVGSVAKATRGTRSSPSGRAVTAACSRARCRQERRGGEDRLEPGAASRVLQAVLVRPASVRPGGARASPRVPAAGGGVRRTPPDALRRHPRRHPRPGPLPRPRAGPRPVLLRARRRRPAAVTRQHLQGAERRPRRPAHRATATSRPGRGRVFCCSTPR